MKYKKDQYIWGILRLGLGLIFLWAFFDKVFGLGFVTEVKNSWVNGGSPTAGFLEFATYGPFSTFYQSLAGNVFVDWLFMLGLLLIGIALTFGIGIKIAGWSGALLMFFMWTSALPPEHHPFLDDHIIYAIILIGLTFIKSGHFLGFGRSWSKIKLVRNNRFLE